jgi:hypothetical protein
MTEDEFMGLFDKDDIKDVADVFAAVADEAAKAPKKDGVWFAENKVEGGHNLSLYAINLGGRTVAWATINNDWVETDPETLQALGKELPEGVTAHRIFIQNAHRTDGEMTNGLALRYEHGDGSGVHADGQTIRLYIMPRLTKIIARLYGV